MRNLHKFIQEKYGIEALQELQQWGNCAIKDSDYKYYRIFTLRCINKGVIPVSVRLGSTRKDITYRAKEIIYKDEKTITRGKG